jgi:hypothetical protein
MADLVTLVIDKYDGSLKAEHGTARATSGKQMDGRTTCDALWEATGYPYESFIFPLEELTRQA